MKKIHLGAVLFGVLLVGVVLVAAGAGTLPGMTDTSAPASTDGAQSNGPNATGSNSMSVESVSVRNQTANGVTYLDIGVAGDLDRATLGHALEGMYDDSTTNVSDIELLGVQRNGATVSIATDGRDSSTHVAERVEHHLDAILRSENQQPDATRTNDDSGGDSESTGSSGSAATCDVETVFYQLDFVAGESIENLGGPEGTYMPDELIRFAHGSSEQPIVRTSDGEFTTNRTLRQGIESQHIAVENGTATITFSVAAGAEPVELTLASYTKPGRFWSRETESQQEFVDADTRTFGPGGPYTLRVDLPEAESAPCETPEATPTPTPTDTPTTETPPPTDVPVESTDTPTTDSPPSEQPTLDLKVNGKSQSLDFGPVRNGMGYEKTVQIKNTGNSPGTHLCTAVKNVTGSENGLLEPERDVGDNSGSSELPQYLNVRVGIQNPNDGGPVNTIRAKKPLENTDRQCVALENDLTTDEADIVVEVIVDEENINNAMSDTATFDVELTLYEKDPDS